MSAYVEKRFVRRPFIHSVFNNKRHFYIIVAREPQCLLRACSCERLMASLCQISLFLFLTWIQSVSNCSFPTHEYSHYAHMFWVCNWISMKVLMLQETRCKCVRVIMSIEAHCFYSARGFGSASDFGENQNNKEAFIHFIVAAFACVLLCNENWALL